MPKTTSTKCGLCKTGFPKEKGIHYGTQALGMIPDTACAAETDPCLFYLASDEPYGAFSNLSHHEIHLDGVTFETAEHAYQFAKVRDSRVRAWLMSAPTAGLLAHTAHTVLGQPKYLKQYCQPDWNDVKVDRMERVLEAKFEQHPDLAKTLDETGEREIIEAGTIDDEAGRFWGRVNGHGSNMLGRLLMNLRRTRRLQR